MGDLRLEACRVVGVTAQSLPADLQDVQFENTVIGSCRVSRLMAMKNHFWVQPCFGEVLNRALSNRHSAFRAASEPIARFQHHGWLGPAGIEDIGGELKLVVGNPDQESALRVQRRLKSLQMLRHKPHLKPIEW